MPAVCTLNCVSFSFGFQTVSRTCRGATSSTRRRSPILRRIISRPMWVFPSPTESDMRTPPQSFIIWTALRTASVWNGARSYIASTSSDALTLSMNLCLYFSNTIWTYTSNGAGGSPNLERSRAHIMSCFASSDAPHMSSNHSCTFLIANSCFSDAFSS